MSILESLAATDDLLLSDDTNVETLQRILKEKFGTHHIVYHTRCFPGHTLLEPLVSLTYPEEWVERYRSESYMLIDPIFKKIETAILPIDWATVRLETRQERAFFGEASEFNIGRQGISFPLRGPGPISALFTVTFLQPDHEWRQYKAAHIADLNLLADLYHAQMIQENYGVVPESNLSPRERECVVWATEGKTISETASLLGISPNTVRMFLDSARNKMGCVNKTHLIAKALKSNYV